MGYVIAVSTRQPVTGNGSACLAEPRGRCRIEPWSKRPRRLQPRHGADMRSLRYKTSERRLRLTSLPDYGLRLPMRMASAPDRFRPTAERAGKFGLPRNRPIKHSGRLEEAKIGAAAGAIAGQPECRPCPPCPRLGGLSPHMAQ